MLGGALLLIAASSLLSPIAASSARSPSKWARTQTVRVTNCKMEASADDTNTYCVFLYNDSFNMREYVQRVLMMVASVSSDEANAIMMKANWDYSALVGEWEKPIAEHIYAGMVQSGLEAAIKPADEDQRAAFE